jgi:hypothetical protein
MERGSFRRKRIDDTAVRHLCWLRSAALYRMKAFISRQLSFSTGLWDVISKSASTASGVDGEVKKMEGR